MNIKLEISFDSMADAASFMSRYAPDAQPIVVLEPAPVVAEEAPIVAEEAPIVAEKATRKPRGAKITEPAAPAIEAPTHAMHSVQVCRFTSTRPYGAPAATETPVSAPVAAAPVSAPAEPSSAASSSPAPVETPPAAAPGNAAAQTAIEAVFNAKGFQGAHQLLGQFGVQRLRELSADKYGELVAYADKMLAK
jgi:hypothetical protein